MNELGIIENGAVLIRDGIIQAIGTTASLCAEKRPALGKVIDAAGKGKHFSSIFGDCFSILSTSINLSMSSSV